jgi:hypothetical protein
MWRIGREEEEEEGESEIRKRTWKQIISMPSEAQRSPIFFAA